jgi:hypothetical protein
MPDYNQGYAQFWTTGKPLEALTQVGSGETFETLEALINANSSGYLLYDGKRVYDKTDRKHYKYNQPEGTFTPERAEIEKIQLTYTALSGPDENKIYLNREIEPFDSIDLYVNGIYYPHKTDGAYEYTVGDDYLLWKPDNAEFELLDNFEITIFIT